MATLAEETNTGAASLMPTRDYLLNGVESIGLIDAFTMPSEELEPLQLRAAQEIFSVRRSQIAVRVMPISRKFGRSKTSCRSFSLIRRTKAIRCLSSPMAVGTGCCAGSGHW